MNDLLDSVNALRTAADGAAVQHALTLLLARHGIDKYTYYGVRSTLVDLGRRPLSSNFPQAWRDRYAEQRYVSIDPIVRAAYQRLTPFTWSDGLRTRGVSKKQKIFMGEAAECGLKAGLTVPIFGPNGTLSILSVASNEAESALEHYLVVNRLMLHMAALYAHEAIEKASAAPPAEPGVRLYPRERECLLWVGKGKTSWEIGEILKISDGTVDQYLKSAARKLSVYGRQHAVAKAIVLGIINP